ncbi:MAG: ribosomal L7Ae/L30e/S12e/Gadd45 family protein [Oscillospiraceae bacterium]|nr:ribosomal L7Ae/L30e/S12e/Gadd45 family protein [Oscillospiraceae bacterium]
MKRNRKIPKYGKLPDLSRETVVVGAKQLKKAVRAGRVRFVYLAENADPAVTEPLEALCADNQIQITWVRTMAELGQACGIEVGAAAAAVLNS